MTRSDIAAMGAGQPLSADTRAFFEPRFGADLSQVRVHTGSRSHELAERVGAEAFTYHQHVAFSPGSYQLVTLTGRQLLSHELAHTIQQTGPADDFSTIARQESSDLNYERARRGNENSAQTVGWGASLAEYRPGWDELWRTGDFDAFADTVAQFQSAEGMKVDGILGQATWDRLRPIGDVIASQSVTWAKSREVCTIAAKERLTKGFKKATGEELVTPGQRKTANRILQSYKLSNVERQYRGTGAAGLLVYSGQGSFVDEAGIWERRELRPGAALQVWGSREQFERLQEGEDIHPYGTAAVFVRYTNEDVEVLHFDRIETWSRSRYEVWVGANLSLRRQ